MIPDTGWWHFAFSNQQKTKDLMLEIIRLSGLISDFSIPQNHLFVLGMQDYFRKLFVDVTLREEGNLKYCSTPVARRKRRNLFCALMCSNEGEFCCEKIIRINETIMKGLLLRPGELRQCHSKPSGAYYYYADPLSVREKLSSLCLNMKFSENNIPFIIEEAVEFFMKLLSIHPFRNGNGRTAKVMLSSLLYRVLKIPVIIVNNKVLIECLEYGQLHDARYLKRFLMENVYYSLSLACFSLEIQI